MKSNNATAEVRRTKKKKIEVMPIVSGNLTEMCKAWKVLRDLTDHLTEFLIVFS